MKKRKSLSRTIVIETMVFVSVIALIFTLLNYRDQRSIYNEHYLATVYSHTAFFENNVEEFTDVLRMVREEGEDALDDPVVSRWQMHLELLPQNLDIFQQMYIMTPDQLVIDGEVFYESILMSNILYEMGTYPGIQYPADEVFISGFESAKQGYNVTDEYEDDYGSWVSVFFPIYDGDELRFMLGTDIHLGQMHSELRLFWVRIGLISSIAAIILGLLLLYRIRKHLRSLETLKGVAGTISEGNLNIHCEIKDNNEIGEIAAAMDAMILNLSSLIERIKQSSSHMNETGSTLAELASNATAVSDKNSIAIDELAQQSDEQKTAAEENRRMLAEVSKAMHNIASAAGSVAEASTESYQTAEQGSAQLTNLKDKMEKIDQSVLESNRVAEYLNGSSHEIGTIIEEITAIAGKTNLLALNAAIEAARAGDEGKGFAVVADEVSSLADKSTNSAKKISTLIEGIDQQIRYLVQSMKQTNQTVNEGSNAIEETVKFFHDIVSSARNVSEQMDDVSTAVEEISANSDQVTRSIENNIQLSESGLSKAQIIQEASREQLQMIHDIASKASKLQEFSSELDTLLKTENMNR